MLNPVHGKKIPAKFFFSFKYQNIHRKVAVHSVCLHPYSWRVGLGTVLGLQILSSHLSLMSANAGHEQWVNMLFQKPIYFRISL